MNIPISEQETVISITRDDKAARIWTNDSTMITKMDKLVERSEHYHFIKTDYIDGRASDKHYMIDDKSLICFRTIKRELTDEHKRVLAESLRQRKGASV